KVLEFIVRHVYERRINEPAGSRPLENLLQRVVKDGFFPKRLAAYANTVRELGNVGTHGFGEQVSPTDVFQSLSQLMLIVEWYFEQEQAKESVIADTAPPGPEGSGPLSARSGALSPPP